MADSKEIAWVAGLLEGEGCFSNHSKRYCSPVIQLYMTDQDVVVRAAKILGAYKVVKCHKDKRRPFAKTIFRLNLYGQRVISWMMTILCLMGERRSNKIKEIIHLWKTRNSPYPERQTYSRGAESVWER